jgi:hypothetical protein
MYNQLRDDSKTSLHPICPGLALSQSASARYHGQRRVRMIPWCPGPSISDRPFLAWDNMCIFLKAPQQVDCAYGNPLNLHSRCLIRAMCTWFAAAAAKSPACRPCEEPPAALRAGCDAASSAALCRHRRRHRLSVNRQQLPADAIPSATFGHLPFIHL